MNRRAPLVRRSLLLCGWALAAAGLGASAQERPNLRNPDQQRSPFQMPDTTQYRMFLQNRLVAFVVPDGRAPVVSFTALIRGGTATDEDPGAAEMLALMLATRGPCWMAPGTFRETLQGMDAQFRVHMSPELTQISLNVAAEEALDGLRVFSGILRETCIDQQGLETFRAEIARQADNAYVADSATATFDGGIVTAVSLFNQVVYGDHPYVKRVTAEEARALDVDHVEDFHEQVFVPANLTLAVSGDFDLGQMAQAVDQRFADWEDRRPPFLRSAPAVDAPDTRGTHYFRADASQTWMVIGHELPEIDPRDLPALQVMNYLLGGVHSDRNPFSEVQDERGLSDDPRGYLEPNMRGPGTYSLRATSAPETAGRVIDVVLQEVERMRTDTVSAEQLRLAKTAFMEAFPLRFENGHATALTFAEEWMKYVSFENISRYRDRIEDVSARDVQRAAQRYLHPQRMQIVVLGPEQPS